MVNTDGSLRVTSSTYYYFKESVNYGIRLYPQVTRPDSLKILNVTAKFYQ